MNRRNIQVETGKRYQKLLADPRHRPRKKKDKRRFDKVLNLLVLVGVLSGGIYMIPQKDKEDFAEMLDQLPVDLSTAVPQVAGTSESASLTSVLAAFIPEIPGPPAAAPDRTAAAPAPQPSGFVGRVLRMSDFPRPYDNWDRTEFETAEAAADALRQMDRVLASEPVEITPIESLRDRKAALYQDGADLRFLIVIEAARPAARREVVTAAAQPAPAVMTDMPSAMREPRAELSVSDTPGQARIARTRIAGSGRRTIELAGISFTDHAADPSRNLVDLRAELPGDRSIYVRGRAPLTVIEDFLSRANLPGLGLDS